MPSKIWFKFSFQQYENYGESTLKRKKEKDFHDNPIVRCSELSQKPPFGLKLSMLGLSPKVHFVDLKKEKR